MTATAIKERPILFSSPMVRSILQKQKTQTRRVVRPDHVDGIELGDNGKFSFMHSPTCGGGCDYACAASGEIYAGHIGWTPWGSNPRGWGRLWVRETWAPMPAYRPIPHPEKYDLKPAWYRADNDMPLWAGTKWRPSIFMPRGFSRITLEIIDIRVQRLQEINDADVEAEGARTLPCCKQGDEFGHDPRDKFRQLWDKLNAGRGCSWESNPWVWAVRFRRIEPF